MMILNNPCFLQSASAINGTGKVGVFFKNVKSVDVDQEYGFPLMLAGEGDAVVSYIQNGEAKKMTITMRQELDDAYVIFADDGTDISVVPTNYFTVAGVMFDGDDVLVADSVMYAASGKNPAIETIYLTNTGSVISDTRKLPLLELSEEFPECVATVLVLDGECNSLKIKDDRVSYSIMVTSVENLNIELPAKHPVCMLITSQIADCDRATIEEFANKMNPTVLYLENVKTDFDIKNAMIYTLTIDYSDGYDIFPTSLPISMQSLSIAIDSDITDLGKYSNLNHLTIRGASPVVSIEGTNIKSLAFDYQAALSALTTLNIKSNVQLTGFSHVPFSSSVTTGVSSIQVGDTNEDVAQAIADFIAASTSATGTLVLSNANQYNSTMADAATAKGWTVEYA